MSTNSLFVRSLTVDERKKYRTLYEALRPAMITHDKGELASSIGILLGYRLGLEKDVQRQQEILQWMKNAQHYTWPQLVGQLNDLDAYFAQFKPNVLRSCTPE